MSEVGWRWALGAALLLAGWWQARRTARTRVHFSPALFVDALLPLTIYGLLLALSKRPLFAGLLTFALCIGWARADRDKRRVLREPIVFTDLFQALDVLRHPQLALPFPHPGRIALIALAAIGALAVLLRAEPSAWSGLNWLPVIGLSVSLAVMRFAHHLPLSSAMFGLTADPERDGMTQGPFATILLHALIARRERPARALQHAPLASAQQEKIAAHGPVVLVQNESFFDLRRLHPHLPRDLLPNLDRCRREARQWGRLSVPSWGANTVRTECAVLTGLSQQDLGFDRFNPYHRFVSAPIRSLAWTLRGQGYRTVCLHPFDRRFYGRDRAMSQLGFDEFHGEELFAGTDRINGYVPDLAVAAVAARIVREAGQKVFLFIITMENHGPWSGGPDAQLPGLAGLQLETAEQAALNHYAGSLLNADAMLGVLCEQLNALDQSALLGFYGDHLPSFPGIYAKLGLRSTDSDYLIWSPKSGDGRQQNLSAEQLGQALLDAAA